MQFSTILTLSFCSSVFALWPAPVSFTYGSSVLWLAPEIDVTYNGGSVWWTPQSLYGYLEAENAPFEQLPPNFAAGNDTGLNSQSIVQGAISRALDTIRRDSIVPWKLLPRNELSNFEPAANSSKSYVDCLEIYQTVHNGTVKPLAGQVDESYNLTITIDGTVQISAASHFGILYGLQSFVQLFYQHSAGSGVYTNLAPVMIADSPKFAHRGVNMDVARNWFPVQSILHTIDAISWNKFNRFHIHMTDAQSWPMDIPALPDLSKKGAYRTGLSYTPADIDYIHTYAIERGIEVIIELDMPGHTTSIGYAYPELIAAFDAQPWDTYCAEPPCGTLKLNDTKVDDFLQTLFNDVLPRVSPYTSYFHTGGDEVNAQAYLLDTSVRSNDTAVIAPLIQRLVDRNHAQVRAAGLVPIVWEEMLLTWNLTLGSDVVVQAWQSDEAVVSAVNAGHKVIGGNYNYWYLDCGYGQWLDFSNGASFQKYYPFPDYCSPMKNWRLVYSYDPLESVPANSTHLVLGADVHIWSEMTDSVNLDTKLWPRASAAGEVLWSGRQDASGQNRSQLDASPRLAEMRERMVSRGVSAGPVQMVFCTQNNATECSL